jgi:succinyl-diaminopimelate desuccinylase
MVQGNELSADEQQLLSDAEAWFYRHRGEFVRELQDLINIPSVSDASHPEPGKPYGREIRRVFDHILGKAEEFGFSGHDYEGYAVDIEYAQDPDSVVFKQRDIALVSHLDVVPAGDGWTYQPFQALEREGYVIGRGSSDNKGGALVDLFLLRFFHSAGVRFDHALRIIYGGAEETTLNDLKYLVAHHRAPYQAVISDSPLPVNNAQKGHLDVDVVIPVGPALHGFAAGSAYNAVPGTASLALHGLPLERIRAAIAGLEKELASHIHIYIQDGAQTSLLKTAEHAQGSEAFPVIAAEGKAGHAAFPEVSSNAILLLSEALDQANLLSGKDALAAKTLASWSRTPYGDGTGIAYEDAESGKTTQNIGVIRPVGDDLVVHFDIRYAVTQSAEDILHQLSKQAERLGGHLGEYSDSKPYYVAPDDPRVQTLLGAYNAVMGSRSVPIAMGGGTHARVIPNALNFGPGFRRGFITDSRRPIAEKPSFIDPGKGSSHGADEWAAIDDLKSAFLIYAIGLTRLDALLDADDSEANE